MESGPERLLTVEEVAKRLDLHEETIRRYLQRGLLKGIKFGNRGGWRIKEGDLQAFIDHLQEENTRPKVRAA
jgi:excisionase family DNA binding protein